MTPIEIKIEMMRQRVSQADIAREGKVSRGHVFRVIEGTSVSDPVQRLIASAINMPVEDVFPHRYKNEPGKGNSFLGGDLAQKAV